MSERAAKQRAPSAEVSVERNCFAFRIFRFCFCTGTGGLPVPVAARSKALVFGLSTAEIVGSNPTAKWMFVCFEWCVLSGRGLCDGLITRPEEFYRLWCVVVCDQETSKTRRLKPAMGLWKIQTQWVVTPGKQTTNNNRNWGLSQSFEGKFRLGNFILHLFNFIVHSFPRPNYITKSLQFQPLKPRAFIRVGSVVGANYKITNLKQIFTFFRAKCLNEVLNDLYCSPNIFRVIK